MPEDSSFNPNNPYPEPDDLELRDPSQDLGNRPASGARHAAPGDVLNTSFQGSANAGDFLGLDVEVGSYEETSAAAPSSLDLASVPASGPSHEHADASVAAPAYEDPGYAEPEYDEYDEGAYEGDAFVDEPEAFANPELAEAFEEDEAPKAARGSFGFVLGAFMIGLLVVAGFVLGPKYAPELMERLGLQQPQNVAQNTGTNANPTNATPSGTTTDAPAGTTTQDGTTGPELLVDTTTDGTTNDVAEDTTENTGAMDDVAASTTDDMTVADGAGSTTDAWLEPNPSGETGDVATDPTTTEDVSATTDDAWQDAWGTPAGDDPWGTGGEVADAEALPMVDPDEAFQGIQLPEGLMTTFDWASSDKLDMIWRDATIPIDAIAAPARLLTPRVGPVRVHMTSGEMFEGRLYALGEGQVWLDTQPGRIGLDGERVTRFERIVAEEASLGGSPLGTASGERVRVRVPGGVMYGRVVSQDGDVVTLITDEGGRVALNDAVVEELGPSRAIVVER